MTATTDQRDAITVALAAFGHLPLAAAARHLFATLGYQSDRTINLGSSSPSSFLDFLRANEGAVSFDEKKALFSDWISADLLFQLTDEELSGQRGRFSETNINPGLLRSYLFFAIGLREADYARARLANIARAINRLFPIPVLVVFAHGGKLSIAYDDGQLLHNHSAWSFVPWHLLSGVRNNSLKKAARYIDEKPPRPDLPQREELEKTSRRFAAKYLLAVMNSLVARDFLRANRRSNTDLYPDDWKKLPVPDVDAAAQAPVVVLVDQILAARRADRTADISALERQVDEMVATLYGIQR